MIFHYPNTSTNAIASALVTIREDHGIVTTGRVLTLIVVCSPEDNIERIITIASSATHQHPARVFILVPAGDVLPENPTDVLDAEIRIAGDAGASEIVLMDIRGGLRDHFGSVVTPLLLPDTPIVAWWPSSVPKKLSSDPIARIAQRRITDAYYDPQQDAIFTRAHSYQPGDTDLSWSRLTFWRGTVAAAVDQLDPARTVRATVSGTSFPSVDLAGGWLAERFGIDVERKFVDAPVGADGLPITSAPVTRMELVRSDGATLVVEAPDSETFQVTLPGQKPSLVAASRRFRPECLAEELRFLDADRAYGRALQGLDRVHRV